MELLSGQWKLKVSSYILTMKLMRNLEVHVSVFNKYCVSRYVKTQYHHLHYPDPDYATCLL